MIERLADDRQNQSGVIGVSFLQSGRWVELALMHIMRSGTQTVVRAKSEAPCHWHDRICRLIGLDWLCGDVHG